MYVSLFYMWIKFVVQDQKFSMTHTTFVKIKLDFNKPVDGQAFCWNNLFDPISF